MEARMGKYGVQASPERSKPAAPKQAGSTRKIPVVYYLSRNHHLEHPHFIEVPISSHDGLYLKDVIKRLIELRGKGMPSMYSWSCKRSYKNGFVWHDLSEDDLILPVHGNEYVLKGSELLDQSPPDRTTHHATTNPKSHNLTPLQYSETPVFAKTVEASSPTTMIKELETPPSPPPPSNQEENWDNCSSSALECRVYKPTNASDASTQTDHDNGKTKSGERTHGTVTRGVSTDNGFPCPSSEIEEDRHNRAPSNEISPAPTSSGASSFGEKIDTLESLIRADVRNMNRFRAVEEEEVYVHPGRRMRTTNLLMQIITCGSLPGKSHGLASMYKPRLSHMKFPMPMLAGSMVLGDLDCLSENPKLMGMKVEEKEYFSGSYIETPKQEEEVGEGAAALKRSSSFNAYR